MAHNLKNVLKNINEDYGVNSIFSITDMDSVKVDKFSTGLPKIDEVMGGGVPRGRITEIYGPESSGKTTLCLKMAAEAQKLGPVAYVDMEHALDMKWAAKIGVKVDELLISQPEYAEQALDIVERLIESERMPLIVVDSVAALVPKCELEGEIGDANIGVVARMMSQMMRKITASLQKSNSALIFINQQRQKIGVFFGNPETTCGGLALKYYSCIRLSTTRKEIIKDKKESIAVNVKVKCIKNKISAPFKDDLFQIGFDGKLK